MAARNIDLTLVSEWNDGALRPVEDCLAAEEPLEIRAAGRPITVTMRTPGHDLELAAGLLFTEGIIAGRRSLDSLRHGRKPNVVEAALAAAPPDAKRLRRNFPAASGCGICGKRSINAIRRRGLRPPGGDLRVSAALLCSLPDKLRAAQAVFGRTGGLHGAALFDSAGALLAAREDIGRHNAVDKVVGWALLENRLPLSDCVLLVSGRGGFEIVQKALAGGVPLLASVSAPSGLAVRLARELGQTVVGFLRGRRFVVYSGQERII